MKIWDNESWLSLYLGRQEAELHLFDIDSVDETNFGGQLYSTDALGENKVEATRKVIRNFCGNSPTYSYGEYNEESIASPIMISAFDNMKARKTMFENWCSLGKDRDIYIDGRMLSESAQIFFITPDREEEYRKHLFDDSEAQDQPCSMKATSHCGGIIAGLMVSGLNNFITNKNAKEDIREVPFKLSYELPLLLFDVEL